MKVICWNVTYPSHLIFGYLNPSRVGSWFFCQVDFFGIIIIWMPACCFGDSERLFPIRGRWNAHFIAMSVLATCLRDAFYRKPPVIGWCWVLNASGFQTLLWSKTFIMPLMWTGNRGAWSQWLRGIIVEECRATPGESPRDSCGMVLTPDTTRALQVVDF